MILFQFQPENKTQNKALHLFSLLLPGTPVIQSGEELGLSENKVIPWTNDTGIIRTI